jgi:hypothetical protein
MQRAAVGDATGAARQGGRAAPFKCLPRQMHATSNSFDIDLTRISQPQEFASQDQSLN